MSKKTFIVDKLSFQKEFLESITKFKVSCEFLPVHFLNGKLVVFCNHIVKVGGNSKGNVGLYIEYTPESSTLEDGDVFYIKDPNKLQKTMGLTESTRLVFTVTGSHIRAEGDKDKFSFRLYDPLLASKDKTFWNPNKFGIIRGGINEGVTINKEKVDKIQKICNVMPDDVAIIKFDIDEDINHLYIGSDDNDSFRLELPHYDGFSSYSKFSKHLFSVVGKNEVKLGESDDKRFLTLKDESDFSIKYCFVSKFTD